MAGFAARVIAITFLATLCSGLPARDAAVTKLCVPNGTYQTDCYVKNHFDRTLIDEKAFANAKYSDSFSHSEYDFGKCVNIVNGRQCKLEFPLQLALPVVVVRAYLRDDQPLRQTFDANVVGRTFVVDAYEMNKIERAVTIASVTHGQALYRRESSKHNQTQPYVDVRFSLLEVMQALAPAAMAALPSSSLPKSLRIEMSVTVHDAWKADFDEVFAKTGATVYGYLQLIYTEHFDANCQCNRNDTTRLPILKIKLLYDVYFRLTPTVTKTKDEVDKENEHIRLEQIRKTLKEVRNNVGEALLAPVNYVGNVLFGMLYVLSSGMPGFKPIIG